MSRVVLKERQFEPTGISLGSFEAKDLETFDLQYTDTDEDNTQSGSSGGQSSHVPKPRDEDPLEKDSSSSDNKGQGNQSGDSSGGSDSQNNSGSDSDGEDGGDNNIPDEWDPYGENLDDQDPDLPDPSQSSGDGEGGYGGGSGSDDEGDDFEDGDDEDSDDFGGGSSQSSLDQTGSSKGDSSSDSGDSEEGSGDSNNSASGSDSKDNSSSSDNKGQGNQSGDSSGGSDSQNNSGSDSDGEDGGDNNSSSANSSGSPSGNSSSTGNSPSNPEGDFGVNNSNDYEDMKAEPTEEELEAEDQDFDQGTLSDLEKALEKIKETSTESSKSRQQSTNDRAKDESGDSDDLRNNKNRQDEISAAKDILGKAMQDTKENEPSLPKKDDDDDYDRDDRDSDSAEDILSSLGAGNLTTLFNPSTLSDWRARLTKLFDKALGFDIVTNPNLVNKKIEDAPPGREDEIPVIKNVVILLDLSSSMGSTEFKQVISHVDTMLRARKMNNTWFHIVAFGDSRLSTIEPYYTKCKGSQFKKKIMSSPYLSGIWMTDLVPGIILAAIKVHQPDAVIIMTDAGFNGGGKQALERNSKAKTFMKKNKSKIIWALTTNFSKTGVNEFDPTALAQKRYVRFKNTK